METETSAHDEAVDVVAETARRLFPIVSEQRARELAARGIHIVRAREDA